jgi:hypothetical protein
VSAFLGTGASLTFIAHILLRKIALKANPELIQILSNTICRSWRKQNDQGKRTKNLCEIELEENNYENNIF